MRPPAHFLFSASLQNLRRLVLIRLLVLLFQAVAIGSAWLFDLLLLPWLPLCGVLGASTLLCVLTALRLRARWPVTEIEYSLQLACDLSLHGVLLYYTGGSTNPFVSYYLVPLTIAAATLPLLHSVLLSGLALTGYTLLLVWYQPLSLQSVQHETTLINLHLFGMWLNFALSAAFMTFFVVNMADALRTQGRLQAEHRELTLLDQQLLAVATQAAGAAHELSTPLSTMSVLLKELQCEHANNTVLSEDLALLQNQVGQCKHSLQQLVRAAEADRRQTQHEQTAEEWVDSVLQRWHLMRPEVTYRYEAAGEGSVPNLLPPAELSQALLNLLNNAADACPDNLQVRLVWDAVELCVSVRDHGVGVPLEIADQLGKPFFTTKSKGKGFGLGLFLSQASVSRAGGTVKLYNHEEGGTLAELRLPRT